MLRQRRLGTGGVRITQICIRHWATISLTHRRSLLFITHGLLETGPRYLPVCVLSSYLDIYSKLNE